ncbi:MAG: succinylglutamate desuccinylase/aspartoacylase family protein [Candidatus Heimdallarchaeota archaeon]|nr:succinylglutamate desuccinylase/aspartoacylase family protein [Candidatus Heimdallarchaeota archaeon]
MNVMEVFNIHSKKGEKVFGYIDMLEYPHGTKERLPICLIEGLEEGPTFLLTGNIHGNELHGLVTLQEIIQEVDPTQVKGTLIIIPSLNPAGLLVMTRTPLYVSTDPNRLWPDPKPKKKPQLKYVDLYDENLDPEKHPNIQEKFYTKFAKIFDQVDYFIDLHCHAIRSLPYSYLDRVYYDEKNENQKEESQELFDKTKKLVEAFGFTLVLEGPPKYYFKENLQRSTTGSFVNKYRKPGFTVELGASGYVDTDIVANAKIGVWNVLKYTGMIEGDLVKITDFPVLDEKMWREILIRTSHSGFFIPLVKAGEIVEKGIPIFEVRDIFGKIKETIVAPDYGTILGIWDDIRCYPNQEIAVFLIDNTIDLVLPWEYEKKEEKKE